ncbi:hypothetical protein F2Q70_00011383 [Brassica cretica]|uniref:Uncharacterized protein n=1 Tax=Brassica cretica TaxID=69181 RepID=A0A3N6R5V3_BRACR|nr:hypothetical protein F2Q70_00011383 [Brassica cretica]
MGVEKYSGLIAGQKFTGRAEIRPMDREARGGSLHAFRTWCQPYNNLSVYRSLRCRRAWKLYMQPDILTSGRSGGFLDVSWTCSQPCGARGAAVHASGAMRSDTRAATNLKLIVLFYGFRSVEVLLDTPPGSPKNCPEARGGSVRVQISLSRPVSFFMVKPSCLSAKNTVSYDQLIADLFSCMFPLLGSWIMAGGRLANAECLDDIAKSWIIRYSGISLYGRFWNVFDWVVITT